MEAIAVVGLISNVLQFVELGYKLLTASKEMYGAGNEATRSNKDLEFMTREMKRLSQGLATGGPPSHMTHDEQILLELADKCERWADDMLEFLTRLKNKNPGSKLEAFKASVRNYSSRHERGRLKEGLDNYRVQLDVQLNIMNRSGILKDLDSLTKSLKLTNDDMAILKRSAKSLQESIPGLEMKVGSEFVDKLRDILHVSDESILKAKQKLFLDALRHKGMEDRFYYVEPAHEATFKWLLERNPVHEDRSPKADSKQEIRDRFTYWLQNESGIFHISGKPGAGKSTLMKFLYKNKLTWRYLGNWSNGKQLIFAKAFFSRLGIDTQTLMSLIRSLLHQILSTAMHLIPVAFPSHWEQVDSHGGNAVHFELQDIEQGFHNVLMNQTTFEGHKLVFFIDGLDEYQGRHIELVKKLFSWTSSNDGNLKICVSSREWNEFMVGFSECPTLRIHEYTYEDIMVMARDQLKVGSHYPTLVDDGDTRRMAQKIAHKAEGVFQWVSLALNAVKDGILNGDNVLELDSKINSFPNELSNLYQQLFESIHTNDRQKVFEAFRMINHNHRGTNRSLPLMRFWFLNKVVDDSNYAMKMKSGDLSGEDITDILKIARRQIYGRCKGFLIVRNTYIGAFRTSSPDDGDVRFMHSTAYEFLEQCHIKQTIDQVVGHFDVFDRICQTFLAHAKFTEPEWYNFNSSEIYLFNKELNEIFSFALEKANIFLSYGTFKRSGPRFIEFLNELEATIAAKSASLKIPDRVIGRCYLEPTCMPVAKMNLNGNTRVDDLIKLYAISWSIHEFFREKDIACLLRAFERINLSNNLVSLLLGTLNQTGRGMKVYYERLCEMLEWCFSKGIISPNYVGLNLQELSLVDALLLPLLYRPWYRLWYNGTTIPPSIHIYPLRLLELCLRYGARPQLQLRIPVGAGSYQWKDERFIRIQPTFKNVGLRQEWYTPTSSRIAVLAEHQEGVITIRDLTKLWFPHDYYVLQKMIDKNEEVGNSETDIHTSTKLSHLQGNLERNWSEVELGEDLFQWHNTLSGGDIVKCTEWEASVYSGTSRYS